MIRSQHLIANPSTRAELKVFLFATIQTLLVLFGLAIVVLAAESLGGF